MKDQSEIPKVEMIDLTPPNAAATRPELKKNVHLVESSLRL